MKILHLITDLSSGGAEMMLYNLLSRMDHLHYHNIVISITDGGALGNRIEEMGIPVYTLGMRREAPNPLGFWRLLRLLRKEQPQILQTWLYHADLLGLLAGKLTRVPVIAWNVRCSNIDTHHYSKTSIMVMRTLAKLSAIPNVIIVNSEAGRRVHGTLGYHPHQWQVLPNGFDLSRFHPNTESRIRLRYDLGLPQDTLLIGLIARFDPMKDHNTFLQAAKLLLRDYADVHFILAGYEVDYNNAELTKIIANLCIKNHVHMLGERSDIPVITAALDIASSSSYYGEGFPNVIGEAMACAVPCVVTDVGDSALIVGDTGKVVTPKDPRALARAWSELIEIGQKERNQLGLLARCRIEENFSLPSVVTRYEELYEKLTKCVR